MRATWIAAAVAAVLLGGCGGVFSTHSASDAGTTRYDERLVGLWRVEGEPAKSGSEPRDESLIVIGRAAATEATLRVVTATLKKDRTVESSSYDALATTIAGKDHASLLLAPAADPPKDKAMWVVVRYSMPDADTVRVLGMETKAVAADVRAGKVAGNVAESKSSPDAEPELTVTLDAPTNALRAYLEGHGDGIYRADHPLVLRRLK